MLWLALGVLSLLVAVLLVLLFVPVTLGSNVQARFEPSGTWVLACGLALGPVALSALTAREVPPFVTCHVFGKQWLRLRLSRWLSRAPRAATEHEAAREPARLSRVEHGVARWLTSLDPLDTVVSLLLGKARLFEVLGLEVDVEYGSRDVALTGRILAVFCVLSGILPDRYVIRQTPSWESEDRVVLAIDGKFRVWPGRACVGVLRSVRKHRSRLAKDAATVAPST